MEARAKATDDAPNIFQAEGGEVNAEDDDVGTVNECEAFTAGWLIGPMVLIICWIRFAEGCDVGMPDEPRVMGVYVGDMTCDIIVILVGLSFLVAHWGGSMHSGFDIAGGCIFGVGAPAGDTWGDTRGGATTRGCSALGA